MSLLYIIDAYNLLKHAKFPHSHKAQRQPQKALLDFVKTGRLCGSPRNKIILVFDGYPNVSEERINENGVDIVFAKDKTADARIKAMVETLGNPKNIRVVSDDKEIRFFVRSSGAQPMGVEEFINPLFREERDLLKPELNFSQVEKINQELKNIWLR